MGIIGWADAPNTIEKKTAIPPVGVAAPYETVEQSHQPVTEVARQAAPDTNVPIKEDCNSQNEIHVNSDLSSNAEIRAEEPVSERVDFVEKTVFEQLVEAIRSLKLKQSGDFEILGQNPVEHIDISKLELHEVEFLINHAYRTGDMDFFALVREVHAVKRRILDMTDKPDSVSSVNLDSLMELVESKYSEAFTESH